MTYQATSEMASSGSLRARITACAAQLGIANPDAWAAQNMWSIVTQPGWSDDWSFAVDNYTLDKNPDTGERPDVIGDGKILAGVTAVRDAT